MSNYYTITHRSGENGSFLYTVQINPDCNVFMGHFPEHPICPGVCNIQMLKECAEDALGEKMALSDISQCKLTTLMTPDEDGEVSVRIRIESDDTETVTFSSELFSENKTFMKMKGGLTRRIEDLM